MTISTWQPNAILPFWWSDKVSSVHIAMSFEIKPLFMVLWESDVEKKTPAVYFRQGVIILFFYVVLLSFSQLRRDEFSAVQMIPEGIHTFYSQLWGPTGEERREEEKGRAGGERKGVRRGGEKKSSGRFQKQDYFTNTERRGDGNLYQIFLQSFWYSLKSFD